MEKLKTALKEINPYLQDKDLALLLPAVQLQQFKKGACLLRQGQVAQSIFFIETGAIKCFSIRRGRIIWAEFEGGFATIPYSFNNQLPSHEELWCVEDTTVYTISFTDLDQLYRTNLQWANWGRKFSEHWIKVMNMIYGVLTLKSATEKYEAIIALQPDLLQRASLKDIASFLGISQVSISRIRANTQTKERI